MAIDRDRFASRHWDVAPLLSRAGDLPGGFGDLLSADDVDSLLLERGMRAPFFRVVKTGESLTGTTRSAVAGSRTINDLADAEAIRRHHDGGATLVLQSLHRMWPPMVAFCRDLAAELGHQTQCNAYITPAGDAQGFDYHHDTHDVFVLQVTGRKRWQVHQPVLPLPTREQPKSGPDLVPDGQQPLLDIELEGGDALYLPRGFVHAAQTTDTRSIHLTVGVLTTTWVDVLRDIVGLAADELAFRHALPLSPIEAMEANPELLAGHLKAAAAWISGLDHDNVRKVVDKRLSKAIAPEPIGMLAQAEAAANCSLTTTTRPRRGLRWRLEPAGDRVRLTLPDRTVELPSYTTEAVRRLLTSPTSAADIAEAGTELDAAGAVVLVRRMLREGALMCMPEDPTRRPRDGALVVVQ